MALFTNQAALSYNGKTTNSNTVTGEITQTLSAAKTALSDSYSAGDTVTYIISLVNSGNTDYTNLTVTDNLGEYTVDGNTVVPLTYVEDSAAYFINGVLSAAPQVTPGPPLEISGIDVPANGNAIIIYQAAVNEFAPLCEGDVIENTAAVSGGQIADEITASATVSVECEPELTISKSLNPTVVPDNGTLTYTFVIQNTGNAPATEDDNVIMTDTFDPILNITSVTFNDEQWSSPENYTYDEATGEFATNPGMITVPAAQITVDGEGQQIINPGAGILEITGTI